MAPLAPNLTTRVFYDYITQEDGLEHTFQVRGPASDLPAAAHQAVTDLFAAMGASRFATGWKFLRARVQFTGSDFSLPTVLPPGLFTFVGTGGALSKQNEAVEYTFQGRAANSGRRVDLSLYGLVGITLDGSYRIVAGDPDYAWLDDAVGVLNTAVDAFKALDGQTATWYPYLNYQWNSYWERRMRIGT